MSFVPAGRGWTTIKIPTKANTTYLVNQMIYNDGTDNVPVTTTSQGNIVGITKEAKTSAANTNAISVLVPTSPASTFYGDMVSGETIAKTNEGAQYDFSSTGVTISTTSTYDTVTLVKFLSTLKGVFKLNTTFGIEN